MLYRPSQYRWGACIIIIMSVELMSASNTILIIKRVRAIYLKRIDVFIDVFIIFSILFSSHYGTILKRLYLKICQMFSFNADFPQNNL